jgi:hypothetical protein
MKLAGKTKCNMGNNNLKEFSQLLGPGKSYSRKCGFLQNPIDLHRETLHL